LQFLLHVGVFSFAPIQHSQPQMEAGSGYLVLQRGVEGGACFLDPVQSGVSRGDASIAGHHVGVELYGALRILQRVVELSELDIDPARLLKGWNRAGRSGDRARRR